MMRSGLDGDSDFAKKRRPSAEGWVRAERRDEIWWRTGVEDSVLGSWGVVVLVDAWMAVMVSV